MSEQLDARDLPPFTDEERKQIVRRFTCEKLATRAAVNRWWRRLVSWNMLYRHKKGGVYSRSPRDATCADRGIQVVVYEHVWPHKAGQVFVRSLAEFEEPDRFTPLA